MISIPRVAAVALGLLVAGRAASAASLDIVADVVSFPKPGGGVESRLYVALSPDSVFADTSAARRVTAMFFRGGEAVAGGQRALRGEVLDWPFALPPGRLRLRLQVDRGGEDVEGARELSVTVPDYAGEKLALSDLGFGRGEGESPPAPAGFRPQPSRRYPPGLDPWILIRVADRMDGVPDTAYAIRLQLRDGSGRKLQEERRGLSRREHEADAVLRVSRADLPPGRYEVEVEARLGDRRETRRATFLVEGPVAVPNDPIMTRVLLEYVVTPGERVELDQAPDDTLASLWTRFWLARDPDPETPANEALLLFQERVQYAGDHFGIMEPGWRSDRGRIYIRLGAPDTIERRGGEPDHPATEVWYYTTRRVSYVFQDLEGFGLFHLVGDR